MVEHSNVKFRNLGLEVFLLIRDLNKLHLYDAQELLEKKVIECGLGSELKFYATSEACNGEHGSFKLISNI